MNALVALVVGLIIIGVLLWLVNTMIPMDARIRTLINVVVVLLVALYLLQAFGVLGPLPPPYVRPSP